MIETRKSYTQILKSTTIFGGVQVFNIIIGIARSKLVAVLLGPIGIGIMGLYTTIVSLLSALTKLGLGQSAVRYISEANEINNQHGAGTIVFVLNRLVLIAGTAGSIITIVLSKQISLLTFDSVAYKIPIIWLSISVFLQTVISAKIAILQGFRKIKLLAKANMIGAFFGLLASIPLYYFMGQKGIVPAIIVSSVLSYSIAWYLSRKVGIEKLPDSFIEIVPDMKKLIKLGVYLSIGSLLTIVGAYILRIYISNRGGLDEVGFYQAGWAIINGYISMIFTAMATDYYPRLSGVSRDSKKTTILVNQQAVIAILLLTPLLSILYPLISHVIRFLYTADFLVIRPFIMWAIIGIYLRSINWAISYIYLAKGDANAFLILEVATNVIMTILYILGYSIFGLTGIGIALIVGNLLRIPFVYWDLSRRYSFKLIPEFYRIFIITFPALILGFLTAQYSEQIWRYIISLPIIGLISYFSYTELIKRVSLEELIGKGFTFKREINKTRLFLCIEFGSILN